MENVNAWMDALNLSQTVYVGNSLGGTIAVLLSRKYPQRVNKMVLIDAAGYPEGTSYGQIGPIAIGKLRRQAFFRSLDGQKNP